MESPETPKTLTLVEQEMLATLVETTAKLADLIEAQLPATLCAEYRMLCEHSHKPWETLYYAYHDIVESTDQKKLLLRAALETISGLLHESAHAMADEETTHSHTHNHNKGDRSHG